MVGRKVFVPVFLAFCLLSLGITMVLGQDFFPSVDAGVFRMHVRARPGLRIEEMARLCDQVENTIRQRIPKEELVTILDNIGLPYSSINTSYSSSGTVGTADAEVLVSLNQEKHRPTADYVRELREQLPSEYPGVEFYFQPADIVSQILNFGLPSPIDIQIAGRNVQADHDVAQKIGRNLLHVFFKALGALGPPHMGKVIPAVFVALLISLVGHSILTATGKLASNGELRYMLIVAPFWGVPEMLTVIELLLTVRLPVT